MFTTTRGNTYVRCGPYIYSYVLARCDADGRNIYLVSLNSEPDFVPALLNDGRVVYSRWEYSDKDQNRVQSLWTTNQDGTRTAVLLGQPERLAGPPGRTAADSRQRPGDVHRRRAPRLVSRVDRHHRSAPRVQLPARADPGHLRPAVAGGRQLAGGPQRIADYHASGRFTGYMGAVSAFRGGLPGLGARRRRTSSAST